MNLPILFEDSDVLVVFKPHGVVVNRAESVKETTVQDWADEKFALKWLEENGDDKTFRMRSGVCHRLDKETSGCLVLAKNPKTLYYFLKLFKDRKIKKTYTALVHGSVEPSEGEVVLPLKRSFFDKEKWQVHYEGKKAITGWKVVSKFDFEKTLRWKNTLSLLELNLKTGRTHQIRVHLSFLGWPIFSDEKYLTKEQSVIDRTFLKYHFLHAGRLEFVSPSGENVVVEAPLPEDERLFLNSLVKID